MEVDKKAVGQRIKSIRLSKGMTLEEFGKLFGASRGNVSLWEKGSSIPNNERLKQISKIGDLSVDELLHGNRDEMDSKAKKDAISNFINKGQSYKESYEKNPKKYNLALKDSGLNFLLSTKAGEYQESIEELTQKYVDVLVNEYFSPDRNTSGMLVNIGWALSRTIHELQDYKNSSNTAEAIKNNEIDIEILDALINDLKNKLVEIKVLEELTKE